MTQTGHVAYSVDTEAYKGPLEKLLELVEEKKLEITQVSLASVTSDFLRYFERLKEEETFRDAEGNKRDIKMLIADFLVVASRLLLIKSRVLLPSLELDEDEEEDIRDLEFRLKLYQELKGAKDHMSVGWSAKPRMMARDFLMSKKVVFAPPKKAGLLELKAAMARVLGEIERFLMPTEKIQNKMLKLGDTIKRLLNRISNDPVDLGHLDGAKPRGEVVVLFLAVLHLVRDHFVVVEQEEQFGRIYIRK